MKIFYFLSLFPLSPFSPSLSFFSILEIYKFLKKARKDHWRKLVFWKTHRRTRQTKIGIKFTDFSICSGNWQLIKINACVKCLLIQWGRGYWTVNYTGIQSFIICWLKNIGYFYWICWFQTYSVQTFQQSRGNFVIIYFLIS